MHLMRKARSMRDNVKFCNIPEAGDERENCQNTISAFLKDEMRIPSSELMKIKFERIHRVGRRFQNHNRPIVGKVNPEGKSIIFQHTKNLDRAKNFRVADQLPRELEERKKRLMTDYKEAKQEQKTVKWSVDKLVIDGHLKSIQDSVKNVNLDTTMKAVQLEKSVHHSVVHVHEGHSFKGHSVKIDEQDNIVPALHAIYSDGRVARASHN